MKDQAQHIIDELTKTWVDFSGALTERDVAVQAEQETEHKLGEYVNQFMLTNMEATNLADPRTGKKNKAYSELLMDEVLGQDKDYIELRAAHHENMLVRMEANRNVTVLAESLGVLKAQARLLAAIAGAIE